MLDNKIKTAFEQIHADHCLKEKTKHAVCQKTRGFEKIPVKRPRRIAAAATCVLALILIIGGPVSYMTPVAAVSIDVNPSFELQINLYDRVIGMQGYNEEGTVLAETLSVENMTYTQAINCILEEGAVAGEIASGGSAEVTVTSGSQKRTERMQACICQQTGISPGAVYCLNDNEEVEAAHAAGMSFGKYRAYLELKEIDPLITTEEIQELTMRQIRDRIEEMSDSSGGEERKAGGGNGSGAGAGDGTGSSAGIVGGHGHGRQSGSR